MAENVILYNPLADNRRGKENAYGAPVPGENRYVDILTVKNYSELFASVPEGGRLVVCGGDGTLNRFVNAVANEKAELPGEVWYCATGSGNDFIKDVGGEKGGEPIEIRRYLCDLPVAEVKGKRYRFINGVGYGIDGYCCEVGDAIREKSDKPTNYTSIAVKGVLWGYSPRSAEITVDGKKYEFEKVWLAPMMNGRYFGGGMMATPGQDRLDPERKLSVLVFCGRFRIPTLISFPKIFKGTHVNLKGCTVLTGHDITVRYEKPTPLQIDGETISGVSECRCVSSLLLKE